VFDFRASAKIEHILENSTALPKAEYGKAVSLLMIFITHIRFVYNKETTELL